MNLSKSEMVAFGGYEFIGPDPFNHDKVVSDLRAIRAKQLAHLKKSPDYVTPVITEIYRLAYKPFHQLMRVIFWLLTWTDGKFRELADI